jgi:hypothetical protein
MEVDSVDRLVSHWKSQGNILANGNDEETLAEFEARYSVRIPHDMRRYLSTVDGMPNIPGSDVDSNGFRFWPLEQIRSVTDVCAAAGVQAPSGQDNDRYFVFADYFDWSWAYAIDLSGDDRESQRVIHVGTLEPKTVARSFTEFMDLYLQDAKALYVLAPNPQ